MQYNTIEYNITNTIDIIPYNIIQQIMIQYNTIQYNTIQYNTILCNCKPPITRNIDQIVTLTASNKSKDLTH